MLQLPKISIIIPTFNADKILENCLKSIIAQSYSQKEIIIIDGGSTDETLNIAKKFIPHISKIISEPDKGIYDAFNKGIGASTGNWLVFLGADDTIEPEAFIAIQEYLLIENCWFIYGKSYHERKRRVVGRSFDLGSLSNPGRSLIHQACYYRRHLFEKIGKYDLRYSTSADQIFNLYLFSQHIEKTKYVSNILCSYGGGGKSNHQLDHLYFQDIQEILNKFIEQGHLSPRVVARLNRNILLYDEIKKIIYGNIPIGCIQIVKHCLRYLDGYSFLLMFYYLKIRITKSILRS